MHCEFCGKQFILPSKFILHLEYLHGIDRNFNCPEINCHRSFHRRSCFKKHIITKHYFNEKVSAKCNSFKLSTNVHNSKVETCPSTTPNLINTVNEIPDANIESTILDHIANFKQCLNRAVQKFISTLYDNLSLTKLVIQEIIQGISEFLLSGCIDVIEECFTKITEEVVVPSVVSTNFQRMLQLLKTPFELVNTEYKRNKYFEKCNYLIRPKEHKLGISDDPSHSKNTVSLVLRNRFTYTIPLSKQLKSFLELPNTLSDILNYQNSLLNNEKYILSNIINGSLYSEMFKNTKEIVLPLIVYYDDFETGNPLGSHAGSYKLGAVYVSIATIPPTQSSKLENIFLAELFHSSDRIQFGNKVIFQNLIQELKYLETDGIQVKNVQVYFKVVLITGDNLGIHSILGLVQSFSSFHYCRFCLCEKKEMQHQCEVVESKIRINSDYLTHLQLQTVGIKEQCVWHELPNFHIYDNVTCDLMHDFFEGVQRYDMANIISNFVKKKYFSLELLNTRIKYFKYDYLEKNIPPPIKVQHLQNRCIVYSASEMLCLTQNFSLIIGDLIPENDEVWDFYLLLHEVTNILISATMSIDTLTLLKTLITEHHRLYISLFNDKLKPKHHFLIHYPSIILKIGPPVLISSMRFEAKHKELKSHSNVITCRKNLPLTLATRLQLKFCYRLMSGRGFDEKSFSGLISEVAESLPNFSDYFQVSYFEVNSIRYAPGHILIFSVDDDIPQYCEIVLVLLNEENCCKFYCRLLTNLGFDLHLRAYQIESTNVYKCFNFRDLYSDLPSNYVVLSTGKKYISKAL